MRELRTPTVREIVEAWDAMYGKVRFTGTAPDSVELGLAFDALMARARLAAATPPDPAEGQEPAVIDVDALTYRSAFVKHLANQLSRRTGVGITPPDLAFCLRQAARLRSGARRKGAAE